jgi:hypothetical protein
MTLRLRVLCSTIWASPLTEKAQFSWHSESLLLFFYQKLKKIKTYFLLYSYISTKQIAVLKLIRKYVEEGLKDGG